MGVPVRAPLAWWLGSHYDLSTRQLDVHFSIGTFEDIVPQANLTLSPFGGSCDYSPRAGLTLDFSICIFPHQPDFQATAYYTHPSTRNPVSPGSSVLMRTASFKILITSPQDRHHHHRNPLYSHPECLLRNSHVTFSGH